MKVVIDFSRHSPAFNAYQEKGEPDQYDRVLL